MDLSFEAARESGADLVIANDPDADRLAIAIPDPSATGGWRLTGNEVGAPARLAGRRRGRGWRGRLRARHARLLDRLLPGLEAVARAYGLDFASTLTGFKWISRAPGLVFGFEEALGYLVNPRTVRDKDGISAGVAFLSLAARAEAEGRTVADQLDEFVERFGCYASSPGLDPRDRPLADRRRDGAAARRAAGRVGGIRVERIDDLADGVDGLPPSDVLRIRLEAARA